MAKRRKVRRAKQPRERSRDESLLLRSAESLARIIGKLQRQLDNAAKTLPTNGTSHTATRRKPRTAARTRTRKPTR